MMSRGVGPLRKAVSGRAFPEGRGERVRWKLRVRLECGHEVVVGAWEYRGGRVRCFWCGRGWVWDISGSV